jgi:ATP-dependent 26S proteasome regulatory subunit
MENNNSILIIEDAETVLRKREVGHAGTISSILNITDGLLSDCLNISIIATFNTDLKTLDDALLRHGRLVKSYTFEKLNAEKSTNLLHKLGKIDKELEVIKPMTLAEIYFYGENNEGNIPKRKIGFRDEDQSIVLQKIKK